MADHHRESVPTIAALLDRAKWSARPCVCPAGFSATRDLGRRGIRLVCATATGLVQLVFDDADPTRRRSSIWGVRSEQ